MPNQTSILLDTLEDTEKLASEIADTARGGMTYGLSGDLGAGKTTFTRYLVKALGGEGEVSSPSFVVSHEYSLQSKNVTIEHWDLYRLSALPEDLQEPPSSTTIRIIEWAEKFEELTQDIDFSISFALITEDDRMVRKVTVRGITR